MKKIIAFLLWTTIAWASDPREALTAKAKTIRSLCADTAQTLQTMGQGVTLTGRMWFKAPNRMRVEMTLSMGETTITTLSVSDGKKLYTYQDMTDSVQTVDLDRVKADPGAYAADTLDPSDPFKGYDPAGIRHLGEESVEGTPCDLFEARLQKPVQAAGILEANRARIWFGRADAVPRRLILLDKDGKEVLRQTYTNVQVNPALSDNLFVFTPPAGAHVTDGTESILDLMEGKKAPDSE